MFSFFTATVSGRLRVTGQKFHIDSRFHQRVRRLLRLRRRESQHRHFDVQLAHRVLEFVVGEYLFSVHLRPDEDGIHVEPCHDVQPVFFKSAVSEQRLTELARADQHGVLLVVVAHEALDVADEVGNVISDFRLPLAHHSHGKVLLHHGGIFLHRLRESYGGDVFRAVRLLVFEIPQITGHSLQSGEGQSFVVFRHISVPYRGAATA